MSLIQLENASESSQPTLLPMPIEITERAAEMVREAMHQEELVEHGLRVGVTGGGCSGLQYLLDFAKEPGEIDFSNEQHGVRVFIDPYSAAHLAGTKIDYVDNLQGSGFKFDNPNIVRSCGCGSSFST
ncbi:MAG: iron-sulfur cluster assembly accessory protein [Myxococcota bacterium]|nr:iron-sulfur cluster assembly accessory protein [Myxococcota bacterium]